MPRLDLYRDQELFITVKVQDAELLIGRSEDCTIQLPDERVSRIHAAIRFDGGRHVLEDRSRNGTRVNHELVKERKTLDGGDRIYISKYVAIYQPDGAPATNLAREQTRSV